MRSRLVSRCPMRSTCTTSSSLRAAIPGCEQQQGSGESITAEVRHASRNPHGHAAPQSVPLSSTTSGPHERTWQHDYAEQHLGCKETQKVQTCSRTSKMLELRAIWRVGAGEPTKLGREGMLDTDARPRFPASDVCVTSRRTVGT